MIEILSGFENLVFDSISSLTPYNVVKLYSYNVAKIHIYFQYRNTKSDYGFCEYVNKAEFPYLRLSWSYNKHEVISKLESTVCII
jgi:hypothetical protein